MQKFDVEKELRQGPYKGFLIIQCEHCGKIRGFCARQEMFEYHCTCGEDTLLEDLKIMHMRCKCGAQFRYKTNLKDKNVTRNCLSCGNPVDMALNGKETTYVTLGERWR
jgi:hypothetical protein